MQATVTFPGVTLQVTASFPFFILTVAFTVAPPSFAFDFTLRVNLNTFSLNARAEAYAMVAVPPEKSDSAAPVTSHSPETSSNIALS